MKFWCGHKGTISVFLALILLPVVVFGGLVTDAVRIYHSKGLVSEAGELAMNAGLSYYDTQLKDEYGLLAMSKLPEDMDLEKYFTDTIRASGLEGADGAKSFLDLKIENPFTAHGVDGSQIYQTEVEKQQILEYMKYRAPVCIGEELVNKLKQIKDSKKQIDAIEKQTKFAETMDDLQDACKKAKTAIDDYLRYAEEPPEITKERVNQVISGAEANLKEAVLCLFMLYACERLSEGDFDFDEYWLSDMDDFNGIIGTSPEPTEANVKEIFESYVLGFIRNRNISQINLYAYVLQEKLSDDSSYDPAEVDAIYTQYLNLVGRLAVYKEKLKAAAGNYMDAAQIGIKACKEQAKKAREKIETCVNKLEKVRGTLREAQGAHAEWTEKISVLSDGDMKSNMKEESDQYRDLLDENALDDLKRKFQENEGSLARMEQKLDAVNFCGYSLTGTIDHNVVKAKTDAVNVSAPNGRNNSYTRYNGDVQRFMSANFGKQEITEVLHKIKDDVFYQKLQEVCEEKNKDAQKEREGKDTANTLLGKLASAFTGDGIHDLNDINWSEKTLPSAVLAQAESGGADSLDTDAGNADSKDGRKKALENARKSLQSMGSWLDSIAHILESGIENIYITEYGIQMFSYYTVNKAEEPDGTVKTLADKIESLSGDDLTDNKMYRSEVEYLLWGKKNVRQNVQNTKILLYGIRMVFNMIYAFTDKTVNSISTVMATFMSCGVEFLVPVFKAVIRVGTALAETACDVTDLLAGRNVPIIKDKDTRQIDLNDGGRQVSSGSVSRPSAMTLNYKEYLTIFLLVKTIGPLEKTTLARIADCIQLNTGLDIIDAHTMLSVNARIKSRTTFMKKAAELPGSGVSAVPDDWFAISYKSVLGY